MYARYAAVDEIGVSDTNCFVFQESDYTYEYCLELLAQTRVQVVFYNAIQQHCIWKCRHVSITFRSESAVYGLHCESRRQDGTCLSHPDTMARPEVRNGHVRF